MDDAGAVRDGEGSEELEGPREQPFQIDRATHVGEGAAVDELGDQGRPPFDEADVEDRHDPLVPESTEDSRLPREAMGGVGGELLAGLLHRDHPSKSPVERAVNARAPSICEMLLEQEALVEPLERLSLLHRQASP